MKCDFIINDFNIDVILFWFDYKVMGFVSFFIYCEYWNDIRYMCIINLFFFIIDNLSIVLVFSDCFKIFCNV